MARYDDLHTGTIAYATLLSCIVLVVIILLVRALTCSWLEGEDQRKLAESHYITSDREIASQQEKLAVYEKYTVEVAAEGGADADPNAEPVEQERIRIPLDRAKDLLMKEFSTSAEPST